MYEQHEEITKLVLAHIAGDITAEEKEALTSWIQSSTSHQLWFERWNDRQYIIDELGKYGNTDVDKGIRKIWTIIRKKERLKIFYSSIKVAATIVILISVVWKMTQRSTDIENKITKTTVTENKKQPVNEKTDSHENSTLTTADNSTINLDSCGKGTIATSAGIMVTKENDTIKYQTIGQDNTAGYKYNTLTTGRGRQLKVILPDGSTAWLNTASSIRFPLAYSSNERWAEISGEAYFEVNADKKRPFKVKTGNNTVEAMGTRFNVRAYSDDKNITATLLEGTIKITTGKKYTIINTPSQMAIMSSTQDIAVQKLENIDKIIAWKNANFQFYKTPLVDVLNEFKRWYGIDIRYAYADTPDVVISNTIFSRKKTLESAITLIHEVDSNWNYLQNGNVLTIFSK